jgi:hypothetical protein
MRRLSASALLLHCRKAACRMEKSPCIAVLHGYSPTNEQKARTSVPKGKILGILWGRKMDQQGERRSTWSWWYLLLLIQFVVSLWVPFYNRVDPTWIGIPFFYWYQMLWVIIGAILTAIVYFATDA